MGELRIRKRGKTWEYSFEKASIGGKRQYVYKGGFKTKSAAATAGAAAMNEYNLAGFVFTPQEISVADYLDLWMESYCKVNCKTTTLIGYEKKIRLHIKPKIGQYRLATLTPEVLQKLINEKFNEGYSRTTLTVIKGILTGSLSYAVQPLKYLQSSPAEYVSVPSTRAKSKVKTRKSPHVYVPPEQMNRVLERFPEGTCSYLPLLIGYKCGLRIGETYALTWDCIDLEARRMTIKQQVQWRGPDAENGIESYWYFTLPKYDSIRTIEISQDVADALAREKIRQAEAREKYKELYIHQYKDEDEHLNTDGIGEEVDLVMRRESGKFADPHNMQHVSKVARNELGMKKFDYHSLRHTHATILAEKGASPKYVQKRLGHKNIQVTMQIYQHLTEKMSEEGAALLDTF